MSKRKRKSAWAGHRVEERVPPTMETALKIVPDYIKTMDPAYQLAAYEIAETLKLYHLAVKRANPHKPAFVPGGEPAPIIGGPFQKYEAWLDTIACKHYPISGIFDMLNGIPPYVVDERLRRPPTTAAQWLIEVLAIYINMPVDGSRPRVLVDKGNRISHSPARSNP